MWLHHRFIWKYYNTDYLSFNCWMEFDFFATTEQRWCFLILPLSNIACWSLFHFHQFRCLMGYKTLFNIAIFLVFSYSEKNVFPMNFIFLTISGMYWLIILLFSYHLQGRSLANAINEVALDHRPVRDLVLSPNFC